MRSLTPYFHLIRLHRPLPILIMLWPTLAALWMASNGRPSWHYLWIFILGAFIMRSAGDILNDLADRKLDSQISRTQNRPLACQVVSISGALILLAALLFIALYLVLLLNTLSICLAIVALVLAVLYPLMKRVTDFPQLVLGLAYNFGILMSFSAVQNHLPWQAFYWFFSIAVWTVAYDTVYALADRPEDIKVGIRSTAVWLGRFTESTVLALQGVAIGLWAFLGYWENYGLIYFACLVSIALCFVYQNKLIHQKTPTQFTAAFSHNHWVGLLLFIGVVSHYGL